MNYLASFVRKSYYYHFCLGELKGLTETFGKKLIYDDSYNYNARTDPLLKIYIDGIENSDIAEKICSRAVLTNYIMKVILKYIYVKIYSEADNFEDLVKNINKEEFLVFEDLANKIHS